MAILNRLTNVALWVVILVSALLFLPLALILSRQDLFELLNLLICATGAGTAIAFHPAAWRALRLPAHNLKSGEVLVVGVTLASLSLCSIFAGQWLWRALDKPEWLINHAALAFTRWALFISWVMALLASGSEGGALPPSTYKRAGVYVFFAIMAAGVLLLLGL